MRIFATWEESDVISFAEKIGIYTPSGFIQAMIKSIERSTGMLFEKRGSCWRVELRIP